MRSVSHEPAFCVIATRASRSLSINTSAKVFGTLAESSLSYAEKLIWTSWLLRTGCTCKLSVTRLITPFRMLSSVGASFDANQLLGDK